MMIPFKKGAALLAPMVGITNRAFRTLVDELGAPDWYWTEMASAEALVAKARYEESYTDPGPCPQKTSIQLFARSSEALAPACRLLAERAPHERPAGVDLNFGCSAPNIRRMGAGSALSSDPDKAAAFVEAARTAWPWTLSAKLRMGEMGDYDELLAFCMHLCDAGVDFLTIHPRLDSQKFRRRPHWDVIGALSRDLPVPVVGNGDITSPELFNSILEEEHPYALMIGREAVRRPWIFTLLSGPSSGSGVTGDGNQPIEGQNNPSTHLRVDLRAVGLRFIELASQYLPAAFQLESARRFFSYFCDNMSFAQYLKVKLNRASTLTEMAQDFSSYFEEVPTDLIVRPENRDDLSSLPPRA
ncbi:MAG: tRNA-dihydrouridine synthase family protein [Rectinema sp.]